MPDRAAGRRRGIARLSLILYLGAAVLAPLIHAAHEVLWAQPSFESHHTSGCPVIHSEAGCPALGHVTSPDPAARSLAFFSGRDARVPMPPAEGPGSSPAFLLLRTRAPPITR